MSRGLAVWIACLGSALRPDAAFGFLADDSLPPRPPVFSLTTPSALVSVHGALQLPTLSAPGMTLTQPDVLLGQTHVTPAHFLETFAPQLQALMPKRTHYWQNGSAVHEVFELTYGSWPVAGTRIELHHFRSHLVLFQAALPDLEKLGNPPRASDFRSLEELSLGDLTSEVSSLTSVQVLAVEDDSLVPAWQVSGFDAGRGAIHHWLFDATEGRVLKEWWNDFKFSHVYPKNPKESDLTAVDLPDLISDTLLDGAYLSVYAPDDAAPRALGTSGAFDYLPNGGPDTVHFDEVQAYYGATKALRWFRDQFGFDLQPLRLTVRVNDDMDGKSDNAYYVPGPLGPEVHIGRGDRLKNLARDIDVVSHEVAHHIIFQYVQETTGESGVLHEGTADYFAYALSGDPYLGESVSSSESFIRTGSLEGKTRFDHLPPGSKTHEKGAYWSAVLWEIRSKVGPDLGDQIVYESLAYLPHDASLKDAYLALLNADRDLTGNTSETPPPLYGQNKCLILKTGITLGFYSTLEEFDGSSCGLDLRQLARDHKQNAGHQGKHGINLRIYGKGCATVTSHSHPPSASIFLLLIPLLAVGGFSLANVRMRHRWNWKKS